MLREPIVEVSIGHRAKTSSTLHDGHGLKLAVRQLTPVSHGRNEVVRGKVQNQVEGFIYLNTVVQGGMLIS